jgi:hypothetical protein
MPRKKFYLRWILSIFILVDIALIWMFVQYSHYHNYFAEVWDFQVSQEFVGKLKLVNPDEAFKLQYSLFLDEFPSDRVFYLWVVLK